MKLYFDRYAYPEVLFNRQPDPGLKISAVIPCFNEPDITTSLDSLNACTPVEHCEVIIIVNEAINADPDVRKNNLRTITQMEQWSKNNNPWFNLLYCHLKIPDKDAGVGFARKVGMDEAARRFEKIDNEEGLIACFDADSTCSKDYFTALFQEYYSTDERPVGSSIYYEHPLPEDPNHRNGIIQYETHLRYYVHALKLAGYPYSHQTVGSSMVVRSDVYQKIGGMNKRKAGEDFYFLHRLIPSGKFTDITSTTVYPSPRISNRVPFGTGKAMEKWQANRMHAYETYNLQSFIALKELFGRINQLYENKIEEINQVFDITVQDFLEAESFANVLARLQKQSRSLSQFRKNFFAFFDGFKVLKFLHFSRDRHYPNVPVREAAKELATMHWPGELDPDSSGADVLWFYRNRDKIKKS